MPTTNAPDGPLAPMPVLPPVPGVDNVPSMVSTGKGDVLNDAPGARAWYDWAGILHDWWQGRVDALESLIPQEWTSAGTPFSLKSDPAARSGVIIGVGLVVIVAALAMANTGQTGGAREAAPGRGARAKAPAAPAPEAEEAEEAAEAAA